MLAAKQIVALCIKGLVAGSLLGAVVPERPLEAACSCDDFGSGKYACNSNQTACVAGHEFCSIYCS